MPMDLLAHLADVGVPTTLTQTSHVYKLRILVSAGHVYASIPIPRYHVDGSWRQEPATVHMITALGYKVLRYFGPTRPAPLLPHSDDD